MSRATEMETNSIRFVIGWVAGGLEGWANNPMPPKIPIAKVAGVCQQVAGPIGLASAPTGSGAISGKFCYRWQPLDTSKDYFQVSLQIFVNSSDIFAMFNHCVVH